MSSVKHALVPQVQAELDHSAAASAKDLSGIRDGRSAVAGIRNRGPRLPQIEMVESIQEIRTELHLHLFR